MKSILNNAFRVYVGSTILGIIFLVQPTIAQAQHALIADKTSNQPIGTTINLSVIGPATNFDYRFDVAKAGEAPEPKFGYTVRRQFQWTPMEEGDYLLIATVRNLITKERTRLIKNFSVRPVATVAPVVSPTRNTLVAMYSAPPCAAPNRMMVTFVEFGGGQRFTTPHKGCDGTGTMNFLLAGMKANTTYGIRHLLVNLAGELQDVGPQRSFTTSDPTVELPASSVLVPPEPGASTGEPVLLAGPTFGGAPPFALDLEGNVIWYYENPVETNIDFLVTRNLPGGNILMFARTVDADRFRLREIDLAGNTVRETTVRWLTEQYLQMGGEDVIPAFHHEARLLPNGQFILLGTIERLLPGVQDPEIDDVIGDIVLSLDENWNLTWAWNSFDHMDVTRVALQGETCVSNGPGCPIILYADEALDWLHANAIGYSPDDGNLVLSIRHQDWVTKIDYQDGTGSGSVVWNLGPDGDFTVNSDDPNPWFTHQHDPNYIAPDLLVVYDNGNGRPDCLADETACQSRGQLYQLDEDTMTADLVLNADLQNYARAVGAAQVLSNGNYAFNSGIVDGAPVAKSDEVDANGDILYSIQMDTRVYRSFRLKDLYTPVPLSEPSP
jgi:hypothetical protein